MIQAPDPAADNMLTAGHIEDIKLAAAKMARVERRSFQAEMASKYCQAKPRRAEALFGWSRDTVALALHEKRTGIVCLSAQPVLSGKPLWENKYPQAAAALWQVAEAHTAQDPSFRGPLSYTRLTAAAALQALTERGFANAVLPSPSAMADILNRHGYRLRPVLKAKPEKKFRKPTPSSPISRPRMAAATIRAACA
jgi:hypothetical protein